jgi:hypothetical protein
MVCLIVRPTLSIIARLRFCSAIIQSSRVLFLALLSDGYLRGRHTGIEFHLCGRRIALSDDLLALVVDTDIQRVCVPLGCVQD